jgi:mannose-6-phosphate isomerase-like protein (cupin superfamily)
MMKRVVTGHGPDGKAVFVSIGAPPRTVTSQNGGQVTYCWGTAGSPVVPAGGDDPTLTMASYYPALGETSCVIVQFPGNFHGDMHMTDTVDYIFILSGEIWLVLETGAEVHLTPGDCVVQNGTRHAWHNRTSVPCLFVGMGVGATRQA